MEPCCLLLVPEARDHLVPVREPSVVGTCRCLGGRWPSLKRRGAAGRAQRVDRPQEVGAPLAQRACACCCHLPSPLFSRRSHLGPVAPRRWGGWRKSWVLHWCVATPRPGHAGMLVTVLLEWGSGGSLECSWGDNEQHSGLVHGPLCRWPCSAPTQGTGSGPPCSSGFSPALPPGRHEPGPACAQLCHVVCTLDCNRL